MKSAILSICISTLINFFIGCKKDSTYMSDSIIGTWELRQAQTGMIPTKNYSAGNGNILKFTKTDYEVYSNGQLTKKGHYTITSDASVEDNVCLIIESGKYTTRIIYDSDYMARKEFFQISNSRLSFLSGCFALDGGSFTEYEKIEESTSKF